MSTITSRLRVVVLGHHAALSGGELALVRLARHLTAEVDLHVLVAEHGPLADLLADAGATVEVLPMSDRSRDLRRRDLRRPSVMPVVDAIRYSNCVRRRLLELRPDVVHTNTLKAAFYGGVASRACGIPCVWHIRDRIASDYLPATAVWLIRALARVLPSAIVVDTLTVGKTLKLGRRSGIVHVIPSPVEMPCEPTQASRAQPFRVAMVGRIAPWKGQDVLLRAMAAAFPTGRERVALIGAPLFGSEDEAYEVTLTDLAHRLGMADRVEFRGFRPDVPGELADADVMVHASVIPEPYGQVILEAMALGIPVVAADTGGPAEIIADGQDGVLTPPGDVDRLAAALQLLHAEPALRRRLGTGGRQTARRYQPESLVPRLLTLWRSLQR